MRHDPDPTWLPRPLIWLKWGFAAAAVSAFWLAFNYDKLNEYFEARTRRNEVKRAVQTMDEQYAELAQQKRELEKWGFSAEKAIREQLKMVRPGERVILLEEPAPPKAGPPPQIAESAQPAP